MRTLWSPTALRRRTLLPEAELLAGGRLFDTAGLFDGLQALADLDRSLRRPAVSRPQLRIRAVAADDESGATGGWQAELEAPGVQAEDIDLQVERRVLTLTVRRQLTAPEDMKALRRERRSWTLERRLTLPEEVDEESISATLRDGLLRVELPRRATVAPRRITVSAAD